MPDRKTTMIIAFTRRPVADKKYKNTKNKRTGPRSFVFACLVKRTETRGKKDKSSQLDLRISSNLFCFN